MAFVDPGLLIRLCPGFAVVQVPRTSTVPPKQLQNVCITDCWRLMWDQSMADAGMLIRAGYAEAKTLAGQLMCHVVSIRTQVGGASWEVYVAKPPRPGPSYDLLKHVRVVGDVDMQSLLHCPKKSSGAMSCSKVGDADADGSFTWAPGNTVVCTLQRGRFLMAPAISSCPDAPPSSALPRMHQLHI